MTEIVDITIDYETTYIRAFGDAPQYAPDLDWRFVDSSGHGHFADRGAPDVYPTLRERPAPGEGEPAHECRLCGEPVLVGEYRVVPEGIPAREYQIRMTADIDGEMWELVYRLGDRAWRDVTKSWLESLEWLAARGDVAKRRFPPRAEP